MTQRTLETIPDDDPMLVHATPENRMRAICEGRAFKYDEVFGMAGAWLKLRRELDRLGDLNVR